MYSIEEKSEAVMNVQRMLLDIEYAKEETVTLPIDGVFDTQTQEAVLRFQKEQKMKETGSVDYDTFCALVKESKKANEDPRNYVKTEKDPFPLSVTSSGVTVEILQSVLNRLLLYFGNTAQPFHSGYFSNRTEESVKYIQKILNRTESGIVSRDFFSELLSILLSLEK